MIAASRLPAVLGLLMLLATACAGQSAFSQEQTKAEAAPAAQASADLAAVIEEGHQQYLKNCRTCHGSKGTAGVPLASNQKVSGGPDYLVWAIITGPGYMPEFGPALSNDQIAQIATYVLNSWGNSYGIVNPDDVQAIR